MWYSYIWGSQWGSDKSSLTSKHASLINLGSAVVIGLCILMFESKQCPIILLMIEHYMNI